MSDLRYAIRSLIRTPGFSIAAIITLAIGIGANSALFTVINDVLLRPLPYPQPERLVSIVQHHARSGPEFATLPDYRDWREQSSQFIEMGGVWAARQYNLTGVDEPERLVGAVATSSLFPTLGIRPQLGRVFTSDPSESPWVVVLSHDLWRRRFGADPGAIGRAVSLNGRQHEVIGVMPVGFAFPPETDLWVPLVPEAGMNRGYHLLQVVGRLNSEASLAEARQALTVIAARAAADSPEFNKDWGVQVEPLHDATVGSVDRPLWLLGAAVACVLLIACANVAGLLLSRLTRRQQEIALKAAIGASRGRIVRQLLIESSVLAGCAGVFGLILASAAIPPLLLLADVPRVGEISLDASVVWFTVIVSGMTSLAFGVLPAFTASRVDLRQTFARRGSARGGRLRSTLIAAQIAGTVILLAGSGMLLNSLYRLHRVETGFDAREVLNVRFFLPRVTYPVERCIQLYEAMIERTKSLPDVEAAAATSVFPFSGASANVPFEIVGRPAPDPGRAPGAEFVTVTPGYFTLMKIPLLRGREFDVTDRPDSSFVAVISRATADRFFPGQDPIGQFVRLMGPKPRMIVGIVGNTRQRNLHSLPTPEIYVPHVQFPMGAMFLVVRGRSGDGVRLAGQVRAELRSLDKDLPIASMRSGSEMLSETLSSRRLSTLLLTMFATTAFALSLVGVFGVVSFMVSQRTREMGIRGALGATGSEIVRLLVRQGTLPVVVGTVAGLLAVPAAMQLLAGMLFDVSPTDLSTLAAVAVVLFATALLAAWIPARKAARVDPMIALRYE